MITFRIRLREDGFWVPDHPEAQDWANHWDDPNISYEDKRATLFAAVDANAPGVYTLEWQLDELREVRLAEVSERTRTLIREGFVHAGQRFAATTEAQAYYNLLRLQSAAVLGLVMTYPVTIPTIDDKAEAVFSNGLQLGPFLAAAGSHIRSAREGDAALKRALRQATTVAAVQAVQDTR